MHLLMRWRWLQAWLSVVSRGYGEPAMRQEYARRFNARRFWWQPELRAPDEVDDRNG